MNLSQQSNIAKPVVVNNLVNSHITKIGTHTLLGGNEVSIFDVSDYHALTQLIGYAKFLNVNYGNVYYRGENELHETLLPGISRNKKVNSKHKATLNKVIRNALSDKKFYKYMKLKGLKVENSKKYIVEAMLQHYGYSTNFIDVVDNHWIALWFGLNKFEQIKVGQERYSLYTRRTVNPIELYGSDNTKQIYQYLLLIAVDDNVAPIERGIYKGDNIIKIDLRSALPSLFLRPHAQHGLVVKRNRHGTDDVFDINQNIVAIIRLRIDRVTSWLGEGNLLDNANLFPSPAYDFGYGVLLHRTDLFKNKYYKIERYVY